MENLGVVGGLSAYDVCLIGSVLLGTYFLNKFKVPKINPARLGNNIRTLMGTTFYLAAGYNLMSTYL